METTFQKNSRQLIVITIASIIAIALLAYGLSDLDFGKKFVTKFSYYLILIMTGFWVFITMPFFRETLKNKFMQVVICFLMTVTVFVSIPPKYRVLSDETNLLSVSQSMTYRRDILNVTQSKFYYGNFNVVQGDLPTRPLLFPFFTSIVHTLTGYRYQNVFVLNFLILFAFLTMTFLTVEPKLGRLSAIAACLLLLSVPTLTLSASSGGFDVCSLFFFGLSFVLLYRFLDAPSSERFGMLLIQLILLAQIRYESIAYVAVILGILFVLRKIKLEMITKNTALFAAAPFFIIPMLLQRKLTPNTFENPPGVPPFAFDHFLKHFKILAESMVFVQPDYPYPSYLNWLAIIMLVILIVKIVPNFKKYLDEKKSIFTVLVLANVALGLTIVLFHHFGLFPHPTQARLFLIFLVFLAMMPVVFRYFYPQLLTERKLFALAAVSFALYHPVATQGRFTNSLTIIRETEDLYRFLNQLNDPKIMIIAERPGQFTVANFGAVGFGFANGNKGALLNDLSRGLFSDMWVLQKYSFETGKPLKDQELAPEFVLETVQDNMVTASEFVRISKVKHAFYPVQAEKPAPVASPTPKLNKELNKILENVKFK
jgi:hypothetical protein